MSRATAGASESELAEQRPGELRRCVAELAPNRDPDGALPGTYGA